MVILLTQNIDQDKKNGKTEIIVKKKEKVT